jgi:microfibrillar-associated protein 1
LTFLCVRFKEVRTWDTQLYGICYKDCSFTGYYNELFKLYDALGVKYHQRDFSYSFSEVSSTKMITTKMIYNGNSARAGIGIPSTMLEKACLRDRNTAFITRWILYFEVAISALLLLFNYLRLVVLSSPFIRPRGTLTFGQWCERTTPKGFLARTTRMDKSWQIFTEEVLIPLYSAVCTAPREDILSHPVEELLGKSHRCLVDLSVKLSQL